MLSNDEILQKDAENPSPVITRRESVQLDYPARAACRTEPRGRDATIVRNDDGRCTACHAGLAAHVKDGQVKFADVPDWARHPEFRLLASGKAKDPGRLKFNHQLHLTPGMAVSGGGPLWKLGDVHPEYRDRYRRPEQGDAAAVQLDCAACHRADAGDFKATAALLEGVPFANA